MTFKFLKHTWQRVMFMIFGGLIILVFAGALIIDAYFSPILAAKAKSLVLKSSDSLYHIQFDNAQLHLLQGEVVINNLTLIPDTTVYNRQKKLYTSPAKIYQLKIRQLVVSHIHPFKIYFNHKLDIGEILLNGPDINIKAYANPDKNKQPKDKGTLYQRISRSLKLIQVGEIKFNSVKLRYEDFSSAKPAIANLKELDLTAKDLLIDSATQFDRSRFFYCREFIASLQNYTGRTANALYGYKAKRMEFSTLTKRLMVYRFSLYPLLTPTSFFQRTYSDRFTLNIPLVQFNRFDFEIYDKTHTIKASSLVLAKGNINVFSNPRTNPKSFSTDKSVTFPNRGIHMLPVKLKVDTVSIHGYNVRYEEHSNQTKKNGYLTFNNINGHFYNVTNDSASLKKNHYCYVKLSALFMNRASTHLEVNFNLADSAYSFTYKGGLGPMDITAVNVASIPLASLEIKSGQARSFEFNMRANRYGAKGQVKLLYNNLKIQLLKADTAELKMRHLALLSLLANALIIKNNNPDHDGEQPRIANVVYKRPINYPFFETLWRTLLMGIKPSAGLDAKTQADADVKATQQQKNKFFRKDDKADRKKARKEKRRLKKLKKQQEKARKKAEKEQRKAEREAKG